MACALDSNGIVCVRSVAPVAFGRWCLQPLVVVFLRAQAVAVGSDKSRAARKTVASSSSRPHKQQQQHDHTTNQFRGRNRAKRRQEIWPARSRTCSPEDGREGGNSRSVFFFSDLFICTVYLIRQSRTEAVQRRVVIAFTNSLRTPSFDDNHHYNHGCMKLKAVDVKKKLENHVCRVFSKKTNNYFICKLLLFCNGRKKCSEHSSSVEFDVSMIAVD